MVHTMTLAQYLTMWKWIEDWQKKNKTTRLPKYVSVTALGIGLDTISKNTYMDMYRRVKAFKDSHGGQFPEVVGVEGPAERGADSPSMPPSTPNTIETSLTTVLMESEVVPASGSQCILDFRLKGITDLVVVAVEYHQDAEDSAGGGSITLTVNENDYTSLMNAKEFELSWGWKQPEGTVKLKKVMTGQITNIKRKDKHIEIEFTDKGMLLEGKNTVSYNNQDISQIISHNIQRAGLKPVVEGTWCLNDRRVNYSTPDPEGKSYKEILDDLVDLSEYDLAYFVVGDEVHVVDSLARFRASPSLFADGNINVVKGSVNINDMDTKMTNTLTVGYGDENNQHHVVLQNKAMVDRYGENKAEIDKKGYSISEAKTFANRELQKIQRKNISNIDLGVIASPYFQILTNCKVKLEKYHIEGNYMITRLNFKLEPSKAPVMDLTLENYSPASITDNTPPPPPPSSPVTSKSGGGKGLGNDYRTVAGNLGNPQAIRAWIDKNIKYSFYYNSKRSPEAVFKDKKGNCYDQTGLGVAMMTHIGFNAWRVCGKNCKGYRHCNGIVVIGGKQVVFDTTCHQLNKI